jgi:glucokinase
MESSCSKKDYNYYLVGDIGGTNVRLELRDLEEKVILKKSSKTEEHADLQSAIIDLLTEASVKASEVLGCVSIAGTIKNNVTVASANVHWPMTNGNQVKEALGKLA